MRLESLILWNNLITQWVCTSPRILESERFLNIGKVMPSLPWLMYWNLRGQKADIVLKLLQICRTETVFRALKMKSILKWPQNMSKKRWIWNENLKSTVLWKGKMLYEVTFLRLKRNFKKTKMTLENQNVNLRNWDNNIQRWWVSHACCLLILNDTNFKN